MSRQLTLLSRPSLPSLPVLWERAAVSQRIAASTTINRRCGTVPVSSLCDTYRCEVKNYKKYIDKERSKPNHGGLPTGKYMQRECVDLYFSQVIATRCRVRPEGARTVLCALKKLAADEHGDASAFDVKSEHTKAALEAQRSAHANFCLEQAVTASGMLLDPTKDLPTSVLTIEDNLTAMRYALFSRADWYDVCTAWTWGTAAYIRGCSAHNIKLADVIRTSGRGPEQTGPHSDVMCLVLRKGPVHKDKFKRDHVVGAWRNKHYLLCPTFMLSISLMYRLRLLGKAVHFDRFRYDDDNFWRNISIVTWNDYNDEWAPITDVFNKCGLDACKKTHFRKFGIDYASRYLLEESTSSMSKHDTGTGGKHRKAYRAKLCQDVMHVMSYFTPNETYYLPRTLYGVEIPFPWTDEVIMRHLFPYLANWRVEYCSPRGDYTKGTTQFLYDVIPMMARVIVSDGAYLVKDFLQHPVSQLLLGLHGYESWATQARNDANERATSFKGQKISALNEGAMAAFGAMVRRCDVLEGIVRDQVKMQEGMLLQLKVLVEGQERLVTRINALGRSGGSVLGTGIGVGGGSADEGQGVPANGEGGANPPNPPINLRAGLGATGGQAGLVLPRLTGPGQSSHGGLLGGGVRGGGGRTVNTALRSTPRAPPISGALPKTFVVLLNEHVELELESYYSMGGVAKKDWRRNVTQALGKRHFIFEQLRARSRRFASIPTDNEQMVAAAMAFDRDRVAKGFTVTQYYEQLRRSRGRTGTRPGGMGGRGGGNRRRSSVAAAGAARTQAHNVVHRSRGNHMLAAGMAQVAPPVPTTAARMRNDYGMAVVNSILN